VGIGLEGPGDIAGIGVDNLAPAPLAFAPVPTIDRNTQPIASRLAAALADGIAGKVPQECRQRDAFSVIRRESA
jgi:DNA-binding LacI/PurR family transcriptional regulator